VNKFFLNITSFVFALLVVIGFLYFGKNEVLNYYAKPLQESLKKTSSLQSDLENGKVVVFGSSELLSTNLKFIPQNYFNNDLKIPLRVQGNEGHQGFAILSQLATYDNDNVKENSRIVILLSPSWYTGNSDNGTKVSKFLEFMYPGMMNKLYFQSNVDDSYKFLINNYVKKNLNLIKDPSYIYKYSFNEIEEEENFVDKVSKKFIMGCFDDKAMKPQPIDYENVVLNYDELKTEAKEIAALSTNNSYGIANAYFTKYIEPSIKSGDFPYTIIVPSELDKNQEYQDLLVLLELLKDYRIKPLFVMQDLHPYVFVKNRDIMNNLVKTIKNKVEEYGYGYYDMWSYNKEDYEIGTLTDIVHPGEIGWVKINQKIIEYFMTKDIKNDTTEEAQ
jgi:D-alanine transfer protein